jgi:spore coat polysaccharide biosynthesis predicted glycosyltransferase SpsG
MARILFTWELGAGLGHIVPHLPLIESLKAEGHEVSFIARDLSRCEETLGVRGVRYFQAPLPQTEGGSKVKVPCTFAHILYNSGYANASSLLGLIQGWISLFEAIQPDLVVFDHSPTAALAWRAFPGVRQLAVGTGFYFPPDITPLPDMRPWHRSDPQALANDENRTLAIINQVLTQLKLPALNRLAEAYEKRSLALLTFREFDHYGPRDDADYLGVFPSQGGDSPVWPTGQGERVFAYLKASPQLPTVLAAIGQRGLRTLVYGDSIPPEIKNRFLSPRMRFVDRILNINELVTQCDFAVLNGTHTTTCHFLLAGVPVLQAPLVLEQALVAVHTEKIGAGINLLDSRPDLVQKGFNQMLSSPKYKDAAKSFADRHSSWSAGDCLGRLTQRVSQILNA